MGGGKSLCLCRSHGRKAGISPVRIKSVQNCFFPKGLSLLHTPGSAKWVKFFHGVARMISAQFAPKTAFDCNLWLDFSLMWLSCCFWQKSQNVEHVCVTDCKWFLSACCNTVSALHSAKTKLGRQSHQWSNQTAWRRKQHTETERLSALELTTQN